jgi:hypothetical protein
MAGMIIPYIERYLLGICGSKTPDQKVLAEAGARFMQVLYKQFMTEREIKTGGYGAGRGTKCVRANYFYHMGVEREPFEAKAQMKFWYGDLLELGALSLATLAFRDMPHSVGLNNERLDVPIGSNKETITGYIDGLLNFNHKYHAETFGEDLRLSEAECQRFGFPQVLAIGEDEYIVVEFKSLGDYPYQLFINGNPKKGELPGPNDTWGHLGQISLYQRTLQSARYLYIAINRETGEMAEYLGNFDKQYTKKADKTYDAVMEAKKHGKAPPLLPEYQPVMTKIKGLTLGFRCLYCDYTKPCWKDMGYRVDKVEEPGWKGKMKKAGYLSPLKSDAPLFDPVDQAEKIVNTR